MTGVCDCARHNRMPSRHRTPHSTNRRQSRPKRQAASSPSPKPTRTRWRCGGLSSTDFWCGVQIQSPLTTSSRFSHRWQLVLWVAEAMRDCVAACRTHRSTRRVERRAIVSVDRDPSVADRLEALAQTLMRSCRPPRQNAADALEHSQNQQLGGATIPTNAPGAAPTATTAAQGRSKGPMEGRVSIPQTPCASQSRTKRPAELRSLRSSITV